MTQFNDDWIQLRDSLETEIREDQQAMLSLEKRHKDNIIKLEAVNRLISVYKGDDSKKIEEHIADILKKSSGSMHIRDIYKELIDRNIPIPGKGKLENVVTRISRAKDMFVREKSGVYRFHETDDYKN